MKDIQMVDLQGQYRAIKDEIDAAMQEVIDTGAFIRGPQVGAFEQELAAHLGGRYALGVANGTDALQIAFMAIGIGPGDEVITSPFTFIATAEAAALLGARAVFVDIDPATYNLDVNQVEDSITPRTKAVVPIHLFGQPADMDPLMEIARRHDLYVVEDNAQGIGSVYRGRKTGYIGHLGCLSFFPSKNLGCYGDGGAVLANDEALYEKAKMIANHGARKKYYHETVGINSRLDTLQAAILRVKLARLDAYTAARREAADRYDTLLADCEDIVRPYRDPASEHVFHQYTIRVPQGLGEGRDGLAAHLKSKGIPAMVYYPVPLHRLPVFETGERPSLPEAEKAAAEVLSLPMHTELKEAQQQYIAEAVREYVAQVTVRA